MHPLEGIKALSFGTGAAIPDFGKILGELGADVIKIESRDNPDFVRTAGASKDGNPGFNESNRNKRSFGINLKAEKSKEIIKKLIEWADILGENFRGGAMKGLGLDYENVRTMNPRIIYISSQGLGGGGPYHDAQAYGPMVSGASGLMSLWAQPDDPYPVGSTAPLPDHMASKHAVVAVLAALYYRRRTGKGQFIDIAQTEVAADLIGEHYLYYTMTKKLPQRMGNRSLYAAPHGCYRCNNPDDWCTIAVFTDEEWRSFCEAIGNPPWTSDPRFADILGRLKNVDELDKLVEEWTSPRSCHEVMETLQAAGVSAGVVARARDNLDDPQLQYDGAFVELEHPTVETLIYPSPVFRLSATPVAPSIISPLLGQHTEEICREVLGMSEEEVQQLLDEDILNSPANDTGSSGGGLFG